MIVLQYYNITVLQYYNSIIFIILQYYNITVLQYYNITLLQYYSITILHCCIITLEDYEDENFIFWESDVRSPVYSVEGSHIPLACNRWINTKFLWVPVERRKFINLFIPELQKELEHGNEVPRRDTWRGNGASASNCCQATSTDVKAGCVAFSIWAFT